MFIGYKHACDVRRLELTLLVPIWELGRRCTGFDGTPTRHLYLKLYYCIDDSESDRTAGRFYT